MMPLAFIVTACLIHLTCGYTEELYPYAEPEPYFFTEELPDDNEVELRRRNSNFLRFGRSGRPKYELEDDYNEDFARPTRSGKLEKNDHFIRFGRSKQDFLRFGRNSENMQHCKGTTHLRFGRSAPEEKERTKRETFGYKRAGSNYLRFGRNSNFLRFGRNQMATVDPEKSPLIQLLTDVIETLKKEHSKNLV